MESVHPRSPAVSSSSAVPSSIEPLEARIAPASFIVTTLKDAGAGTLRDAIEQANAATGPDDIVFRSGLHGSVKLTTSLPGISDSVTISGPSPAKLKILGSQHQLLAIAGTDLKVSISGLTLSGGEAANGGAVYINNPGGSVTLSKTVVSKNRAVGDNTGGVYATGNGGGVAIVAGTVNIEFSKITGNKAGRNVVEGRYVGGKYVTTTVFSASGNGGGISVASAAVLNLKRTVVSGNEAGLGGGIYNQGTTNIQDGARIVKNTAQAETEATGGGIFNGTNAILSVANSKILKNRVVGQRGYAAASYADSPGTGGSASGGGIFNAVDGIVTIMASKLSGNSATGGKGGAGSKGTSGPGPYYSQKRGDVYDGGIPGGAGGAGYGGAIANLGSLTIESSKLTGNSAIGGAGGTGTIGSAGEGAGYYARKGGPGGAGAQGGAGGLASGGAIFSSGDLTVRSSKVSGNKSIGGEGGTGGKGGTGGRGASAEPPSNYYGTHTPGKPPGPGGKGGKGGPGGLGGAAMYGGIHNEIGTTTIDASIVSGNVEQNGSVGAKGAHGKTGKRGSKGGGNPYYG